MKSHAAMNRVYRLVWSQVQNAWVAVAETARGRGKGSSRKLIAAALSLTTAIFTAPAQAAPTGGQLVSGAASIAQSGATTTITQASQNLSLNWQSFNIAAQETVNFLQPSAAAIAVNRIFDSNGSQILGRLNGNGQVYLINPNGILFGQGSQVNVGGLVASTLDVTDASLGGNARSFAGPGTGSVVNHGTINAADGGYVALLGNTVANQGTISARLGTVALGAGSAATLTFSGNSLVRMQVDQSVLNSLVENGGLITADGGMVIMSAGAQNALLASVVNNTGVIEARTVDNHEGTITLLGGMSAGSVNVGGTLDASAPNGGNGGFIETSAASVKVADGAKITTAAASGLTGSWLIDPVDFTIAASGGDISGLTLSTNLSNAVLIQTATGNINVNDVVTWSANQLTLNAWNNININSAMNGSGSASLSLLYGQSSSGGGSNTYHVNAPVNLPSGNNFSTQLGTGGMPLTYTVINSLGSEGSVNATDLQGIAATANLGGNYALGSNIAAAATSTWNTSAGFTPIGTPGNPFTGTFDGLGHTVSDLTVNLPSTDDVGLFGYLAASSAIKNVGLVRGSVIGQNKVGELVGINNGGTVSGSYATGSVSGNRNIGGLVGLNGDGFGNGTIDNSYATGGVTASWSYSWAGGLVGANIYGTISNSHATGSVNGNGYVGGLVGTSNGGTINNSYAITGIVTGTDNVGGLAGGIDNLAVISSSYATGDVNGNREVGGLVGYALSSTVKNSHATGIVNGTVGDVGGLVGWSDIGTLVDTSYATGSVTGGGENVGGLVGHNFGDVLHGYATGSVSGSTVQVGGLVGYNDSGATVRESYAEGSVNGHSNIGGLVGQNSSYGEVSNSYATGNVTGDAGSSNVGGLVGYNFDYGAVSNSYATGSVTGTDNVGGLVGYRELSSTVSNSFWGTAAIRGNLTHGIGYDETTAIPGPSDIGAVGLDNIGLKSMANFAGAGWNIASTGSAGDIWRVYEGSTTPWITFFLKPLTVTASDDGKTYDGNAYSGGNGVAYSVASPNPPLSGSISYGGTSQSAVNANTYTISASGLYSVQQGYDIGYVDGTLTVDPRPLSASITTGSTPYGAALVAGTASFSNIVPGDDVTPAAVVVNTTGLLSTGGHLTAGSHSGIESVSSTLGGTDAGNYTFAGATGNYTVSKLVLSGALAAGSSIYGAALAPGASSLTGVVSGDLVSPGTVAVNTAGNTSTSGHLKAGSYTGIESVSSISGTDAGNYTFAGVVGNYSVSQLALNGSITPGSSTYGTALVAGTASFNNAVAGDLVSLGAVTVTPDATSTSGHLTAGSHNGIESVGAALGGTDAGNYTFAGATGNYTVGKLALSGSITSGSSIYGAALAPGAAGLTGVVSGDAVTPGAVAVNTTGNTSTSGHLTAGSHTGIESVSSISGTDAGNYTFAGATGNYTVGKLALSGSITSGSSIYGAALAPGASSLTGVVSGDLVTPAAVALNTTGNTSTSGHLKAAGYTGIESVSSISGTDAGNYSFAGATGNYSVSKLALNGSIATGSSTYGAALTSGVASFNNAVSGDMVSLGAATVTPDVTSSSGHLTAGTHTGIESVGAAIGGADAGNYTFAGATGNYTVSPLALSGSIAAGSSTYGAALTPGAASLAGVVSGDLVTPGTVAVNTTGNTSTSGHLKTGSYTGIESVSSISGTDAGNYTFAGATGNYAVGKAPLSGLIAPGSSSYGATLTPGAASLAGVVPGDLVSLGAVTVTPDVTSTSGHLTAGSHTGIESVGAALGGSDAGNYIFAGAIGNYTVSPLNLAVSGVTANNKVYDATAAATLGGTAAVTPLAGDLVSVGGSTSGLFDNRNVGTGKPVTVSGFTLGGTDAGNYRIVQPIALAANITPATLNYTATPASFFVGQTPSGLSGAVNGFLTGDNLAASTSGTLAWTSTAAASSQPGQYPIDGGGLIATNYVFVQAPGNATALTLRPGTVDTGALLLSMHGATGNNEANGANTSPANGSTGPTQMADIGAFIDSLPPTAAGPGSGNATEGGAAPLTADIVLDVTLLTLGGVLPVRIVNGGILMPSDLINVQ